MCQFENIDGSDGRGPVDWHEDHIVVGFWWLGTKSLTVDKWPADKDDTFGLQGVEFVEERS